MNARGIEELERLASAASESERERAERVRGQLAGRYRTLCSRVDVMGKLEAYELYRLADGLARMAAVQRPVPEDRVDLMRIALRAAEIQEQPEMIADCRLWIGIFLNQAGRYREAFAELSDAYEECHSKAPGTSIKLLTEMGAISRATDEFGAASARLHEALDRTRRTLVDDPELSAMVYLAEHRCTILGELGRLHQRMGNLDRAASWFAAERAALTGDESVRLTADLNAIRFAFATRSFGDLRRRVSEVHSHWGDRAPDADLALILAEVSLRELAPDVAPETLRAAAEAVAQALVHPELGADVALWPALRTADLLIQHGQIPAARRFLDLAEPVIARLWRYSTPQHARYQELFVDAVESRLLRAAGASPEELARKLSDFHEHFDAFLGVWGGTPLRPGGVGFLGYDYLGSSQSLGELLELTLAVDEDATGVAAAFELLMQRQALGSLARSWHLTAPTLREVQEDLIRDGEVMLLYAPSPGCSHLFVVERDRVNYASLSGRTVLQEARDDFADAFFRAPGPGASVDRALNVTAQELGNELLPEVAWAALMRARRVMIVGAELLGETPFEWFADAKGRRLGATHAVSYLPSVPVGLALARPEVETSRGLDLVMLAGPSHSPAAEQRFGLTPVVLPSGGLDGFGGTDPQRRMMLHERGEATYEALDSAATRTSRVLQILAHGAYDSTRERPAVLLLAPSAELPDGVLRCADVERLQSPPVVVLAACGTERGRLRRGEDGVSDFVGAFLRAGAHLVLVSPANLDTTATLELTRIFQKRLAAGDEASEALRVARVHVQSMDGYGHPYYHSTLRAVGYDGVSR